MQLPMYRAPAVHTSGGSFRVMLVLPPDFLAPVPHQRHRFPPMGPALVAAILREAGIDVALTDLAVDAWERPLSCPSDALLDQERLERHLHGGADAELEALTEELLGRFADQDVDAYAFSVDRHTQVRASLLLAVALKRRTGLPVVLGGGNYGGSFAEQGVEQALGLDIVTNAFSPDDIREVFRLVRELPRGRTEAPFDPVIAPRPTPIDEWPLADFGIYDLDRYRRDPFAADGPAFPSYDGSIGRQLFLPYFMSLECQYACSFCQRGGTQSARSHDRAVRDLATLAERHGTRDFLFFNAQYNLHVEGFAQALIAAKLDLRWGDSFRVAPRRPRNVYETMARSGCVQLTFGVESASDRMLKKLVKGHTAALATAAIQDAHALDIFTRVNLLPCFPGETRADLDATVRWVAENAHAIDDISPSSFYLRSDSPIGKDPERWGVRVREVRELEGDHRFRKIARPLTYDEVDGMTWEEREPTLRAAEEELRVAWRDGRKAFGFGCTRPAQAFALARRFGSKAKAYAQVATWVRRTPGLVPDVAHAAAVLAGGRATQAGAASALETLRTNALATLRAVVPARLSVEPDLHQPGRLSFLVSDAEGTCRLVLARAQPDTRAFRKEGPLAFWYSSVGREPSWLRTILTPAANALLAPAFLKLAGALDAGPAAVARPEAFPRWSVTDLVRLQLKPAASLFVSDEADPFAGLDDVPAKALSRFYFARAESGELVANDPGPRNVGRRMAYVGRDQVAVDRLRDIETEVFLAKQAGRSDRLLAPLHDEFGRLLGFPPCCTKAFSQRPRAPGGADEYSALAVLDWHLRPVDWRLNFILAFSYQFPFLIHSPCSPDCAATRTLVDETVARAYPGAAGKLIERVLSTSAVVFADDRILPFRAVGEPENGELVVAEFNVDPAPEALANRRDPFREIPVDSQAAFRDAEVELLRVQGDALEVFATGSWRRFVPPGGLVGPPPRILVAR